jgi:hypothetical protein
MLELASGGTELLQKRPKFLDLVGGVADDNPHAAVISQLFDFTDQPLRVISRAAPDAVNG